MTNTVTDEISIHALREEGDAILDEDGKVVEISIHALREEGDLLLLSLCSPPMRFLSTPSARRATQGTVDIAQATPISIHALREEGDLKGHALGAVRRTFLSTPSARRATNCNGDRHNQKLISIHALREEGDRFQFFHRIRFGVFLSTPSARRATHQHEPGHPDQRFLSTPSARRATFGVRLASAALRYFYPRPPRGGRQKSDTSSIIALAFLSTPSARRATRVDGVILDLAVISIHALREEGDRSPCGQGRHSR